MILHGGVVFPGNRHGAGSQSGWRITLFHQPVGQQIAVRVPGMHKGGVPVQGGRRIEQAGQGRKGRVDARQGHGQGLAAFGQHQGHGIAPVAHAHAAKDGLGLVDNALAVGSGHVAPGEHSHDPGCCPGSGDVQAG